MHTPAAVGTPYRRVERIGEATLYLGDVLDVLRMMPDASVHCVVTSPPYWGLRDYGHDGQIGLEPTPEAYVAKMVEVFREVRRVLRDDGTLWLNLGDSYAAQRGGTHQAAETLAGGKGGKTDDGDRVNRGRFDGYNPTRNATAIGLKHKDLVGIPWRVAFALQADGWYLRQDIIWHKPNPMPESVTDRCTKAHEYIFLLTKSARYYYDAEAVKEPFADERMGNPGAYKWSYAADATTGKGIRGNGGPSTRMQSEGWNADGKVAGRNRRSVWTVTTKPYRGAHFATFPPALITPCILAGTSERGCCPKCGKPWERVVEARREYDHVTTAAGKSKTGPYAAQTGDGDGTHDIRHGVYSHSTTIGWRPGCECGGEPVPCTVLDPFVGSGTTAAVALEFGRRAILIELNTKYVELIRERLRPVAGRPLLAFVGTA